MAFEECLRKKVPGGGNSVERGWRQSVPATRDRWGQGGVAGEDIRAGLELRAASSGPGDPFGL